MMWGQKVPIALISGLAVCSVAGAITTDLGNPYRGVVERNVFGLKSPAPPPAPEENKPPPPKITPTGITTILGNKRALFKVQLPARPPEPAKEQSYILTEGQREGSIEVLEIDEKIGAIKFNNFGTVMTLTLEKDGAKVPNTPPAAAGAPPGLPPPGPVGYAPPAAPSGLPQNSGVVTTVTGGNNSGMRTLPQRTLRLPNQPGSAPNTAQGQDRPLTHEEQMVIMEVQREANKAKVQSGSLPPLPPTPITPQ